MARLVNSGAGPGLPPSGLVALGGDPTLRPPHPAGGRPDRAVCRGAGPHPPTPAPTPVADTDTNTNTNTNNTTTNTSTDKITGADEPRAPGARARAATAPGAVVAGGACARGPGGVPPGPSPRSCVCRPPASTPARRSTVGDSTPSWPSKVRKLYPATDRPHHRWAVSQGPASPTSAEFATTAVLATQLSRALPRSGKAAGATATIAGPEPVRTPRSRAAECPDDGRDRPDRRTRESAGERLPHHPRA